jgi:hypothetical protein
VSEVNLKISLNRQMSFARAVQAFTTFLLIVFAAGAHAEAPPVADSKVIYSGHNVTQTANVYPTRRCTIGTQLLGCGVNDSLTLATSPWLAIQYNMYNLDLRYQIDSHDEKSRAVQISYFKTYDTKQRLSPEAYPSSPSYDPYYCTFSSTEGCFTGYMMEALWVYWIQSQKISEEYTFHWNIDAAYYWDDRKPFSLRRPQAHKTPWQINLMTLHEFHMTGGFYLQAEIGVLGALEKFPPFHSGASISYRGKNLAAQFGFSATGSLNAWASTDRTDYHARALENSVNGIHQEYSDYELRQDFSIHPELFVQYFFDI